MNVSDTSQKVKAIVGGRLIDGTGREPIEDSTIVIEEDKIISIGPSKDTTIPKDKNVQIIDATGKSVLPGLIDSHLHLVLSKGERCIEDLMSESNEVLAIRILSNAQKSLSCGTTTVRDCADRDFVTLEVKRAIEAGLVIGPRIIACGPAITTTGGHIYYMGTEADSKEDVIRTCRMHIKHGVDWIKVCATGGGLTPGTNVRRAQYSAEALAALVEDAHRLARKVCAHAHGTEGIRNCARAGIDSIEHCTWLGPEDGYEYDEETVHLMISKKLTICHTIAGERTPTEDGFKGATGLDVLVLQRRMFEVGARFVLGSDAGIPRTKFEDFPRSIEVAVKTAGFSNMEAIQAATSSSAKMLGLDHQIGTLEPDKMADMIIVTGDPLEDIVALRKLDMVIKSGQIVAIPLHRPGD